MLFVVTEKDLLESALWNHSVSLLLVLCEVEVSPEKNSKMYRGELIP